MKQPLLKGKSDAVQVILTSMDKTPEALILLLRISELVKLQVQHLETWEDVQPEWE